MTKYYIFGLIGFSIVIHQVKAAEQIKLYNFRKCFFFNYDS